MLVCWEEVMMRKEKTKLEEETLVYILFSGFRFCSLILQSTYYE
jgi:hypothetical protein